MLCLALKDTIQAVAKAVLQNWECSRASECKKWGHVIRGGSYTGGVAVCGYTATTLSLSHTCGPSAPGALPVSGPSGDYLPQGLLLITFRLHHLANEEELCSFYRLVYHFSVSRHGPLVACWLPAGRPLVAGSDFPIKNSRQLGQLDWRFTGQIVGVASEPPVKIETTTLHRAKPSYQHDFFLNEHLSTLRWCCESVFMESNSWCAHLEIFSSVTCVLSEPNKTQRARATPSQKKRKKSSFFSDV